MHTSPAAHPTPYPDVNATLHLLVSGVRAVLDTNLVGIYLYGSLSLGDFDPASSDIDFLVVTRGALPPETLTALARMHTRIATSGASWAKRLEGSYISAAAIRRHDPADAMHPTIGVDWDFGIGVHRADWIVQRHIVREHGVTLWGPPPHTLIDSIAADTLRATMAEVMRGYWVAQLDAPEWLRTREYQAFAILTMCRVLYTLTHGTVVSKPVAAAWARAALGERWSGLIETALRWRTDHTPDDLTATLSFIRFTLARCRDAYPARAAPPEGART